MNISSRTIAGVALAALAPMALAADLQVNANEHYFQDWVFNVSDNPRGCTVADVLASTDVITGTLGPLTYRVESLGAVTQSWVDCRWPTFANNIPPGNDHPGTIDTHHNGAGTYRYTFSAPLPAGTVLFMQDFESNEVSEITFLDCRGQPVDASGFDWLRVSAPSATPPVVIPQHTPGASWHIVGTTSDTRNETTGIVIGRGDVCGIQTVDTKPAGIGGGRHYFLGVAAASLVSPAPAPVPTLGPWALLALAGLMGAARVARRPH